MSKLFEHAKWIFLKEQGENVCNTYFDYKTSFQIETVTDTALYISAHSLYAVYINGQFVDCGQYPGYEDYQVYDKLDITSYLIEGTNSLFITQYVAGIDCAIQRKQIPGIIFSMWQDEKNILYSTPDCLCRINPYYKNGEMDFATWQIGYIFQYDSTQEESAWQKSCSIKKAKALFERPLKKLPVEKAPIGTRKAQGIFLECDANKPVGKRMQDSFLASRHEDELIETLDNGFCWNASSESFGDGVYFIFDMETENVGFLSLDFDVPASCEVLIGFGEHLEDLRVRSYIDERNFCMRYQAKAGRNTFFHPFMRMGLRYLQLHIYSKTGTLYHAGIRPTYYPLNYQNYTLADALHQKIYEVGCRTLQHCIHEHYEDCPWREQALYTFDSRIQMLCGYYAFKEYELPKVCLQLMARSLREDGTLELQIPGKAPITIPAFTAVFIRQVYEYVEYSNDKAFITELFDCLQAIVTHLEERLSSNYLLPCFAGTQYWNFYEWKNGLSGGERYTQESAPYELPLNAFVSDAFACYAKLCKEIAPEQSVHYEALHQSMNAAIHTAFYDSDRQVYITRLGDDATKPLHALTQALALYIDAVPSQIKKSLFENIMHGDMIPCTLSSSIYMYDAFLREGDVYRNYVKTEIERRWGKMLFSGATTFWETDEGHADFSNAGSLCHGWSAVPIYLYGKYHLV